MNALTLILLLAVVLSSNAFHVSFGRKAMRTGVSKGKKKKEKRNREEEKRGRGEKTRERRRERGRKEE
jgi:tmRNA-binding protein